MFRLAALLIVPLILLGGLEGALRLGGYGYPTTFFLEAKENGERVLIENERFGWRFFPKNIARSPSPMRFAASKRPHCYRIFLFGESAALGDPKPAFGMGRYLEALLRERYPNADFEVVCVAMTAINSHAILPIARECSRYQGDLWIAYMGNNEMEGPFGANTIFGPRAPSLGVVRTSLAVRQTKVGQLLQSVTASLTEKSTQEPSWTGMKMFLQQQLPPNDPRKQTVYSHYRRNLEDIVQTALKSGAKPLLCTVASNLKDCPPFASQHSIGFAPSKDFETTFSRGRDEAATNDWWKALESFSRATAIDPNFAEAEFRAGDAAFNLTNYSQAATFYARARDFDALPFRADSSLNQITREVATHFSSQGAQFIDLEAKLNQQAAGGIGGTDLFFDHVHLAFEGNYKAARVLAQEVAINLPSTFTSKTAENWASMEVCNARLGLTDWNRSGAYEEILRRVTDAPFTNQVNYLERAKALVSTIRETRRRMQSGALPEVRKGYEDALAKAPGDFRLHENFAEFLESAGSLDLAVKEWQRVSELLPHHYAAYYQVGRVLNRQGKYAEATESLRTALSLRPDLVEARIQLGQSLLNNGKASQAVSELNIAKQRFPNDARIDLQLGKAFLAQKMRAEAGASFRHAIRLSPTYWEAHYLLGVELASDAQFAEAQSEFEEVVRLQPDYASAHFNLGVALAKQSNVDAAIASFRETLRLNPRHRQASEYLQTLETKRARP